MCPRMSRSIMSTKSIKPWVWPNIPQHQVHNVTHRQAYTDLKPHGQYFTRFMMMELRILSAATQWITWNFGSYLGGSAWYLTGGTRLMSEKTRDNGAKSSLRSSFIPFLFQEKKAFVGFFSVGVFSNFKCLKWLAYITFISCLNKFQLRLQI